MGEQILLNCLNHVHTYSHARIYIKLASVSLRHLLSLFFIPNHFKNEVILDHTQAALYHVTAS